MEDTLYSSPIGTLKVSANSEGITAIRFQDETGRPQAPKSPATQSNRHLARIVVELDRYFAGKLTQFKTPLAASGTPFQTRVWKALSRIAPGNTTHYGAIAADIGNPKASRAVGLANNRNPLPIVVPCHRVVGKSGSLVGYAGDIWRKEWLLSHEGALL